MEVTSHNRRAAQYVRMSTDLQEFSTANQRAAIAAWAVEHHVEIVATYEDAGKSGLTLAGRPALRQMIADVLNGSPTFDTILVYDVSRWGRFQDADESAHLEFLCRSAGVAVHYCAEPFANDGTPLAQLCKVLKRTLAAEYSRELSQKVFVGKARLAKLGFHQGSVPGFGLQRRLLDRNGTDKGTLAFGDRKSLVTDRVKLAPSSIDEVATVVWMYRAYADEGLSMAAIRENLNTRGVTNRGRPWTTRSVYTVLTSPKYIGDNVWGTSTCKLSAPRRRTPQQAWTTCQDAFAPVVPRDLFERVQRRRAQWPKRRSDQELLERLKAFVRREGRITWRSMAEQGLLAVVYRKRFGSMDRALALCGIDQDVRVRDATKWNSRLDARRRIVDELRTLVEMNGSTFTWYEKSGQATINGELRLYVYAAAVSTFRRTGKIGWQLSVRTCNQDLALVATLDHEYNVRGYYLLPACDAIASLKLRDVNEPSVELFHIKSLADLAFIAGRLPITMEAILSRTTTSQPNPFDIGPPAAGIPRCRQPWRKRGRREGKSSHRAISYVACYFARKRRLIDSAASTRDFLMKLSEALFIVLSRPTVLEKLGIAGLRDAPVALFGARPALLSGDALACTPGSRSISEWRDKSGLCGETLVLFAGRRLSSDTIDCLAKLKDCRQVEAAREMLAEQRCSYQMARALLSISTQEELVGTAKRPAISGSSRSFDILSRERVRIDATYRLSHANYLPDAVALASLIAFARRLIEEDAFNDARASAGTRPLNSLKSTLSEAIAWRNTKARAPFSRGGAS